MASIEEALRTAGADGDLQTILRLLEDQSVGFNRQEAAAGAFTGLDTAVLANHLNVRMLSVIRNAQQQQQNPDEEQEIWVPACFAIPWLLGQQVRHRKQQQHKTKEQGHRPKSKKFS